MKKLPLPGVAIVAFVLSPCVPSAVAMPEAAPTQTEPPGISDSEIHKILVDRIDIEKQAVGIVVGIVSPQGRRIVAYGSLDQGDPRPLNGDTVFEIGSTTKVFTSLVLMDMVQRGEVSLDDPASKYLPPTVHVPERGGRKITLRDLSTQTSGLPRMPGNFHPKDPGNPYADYTAVQLYEFLSGYTLTRDIGQPTSIPMSASAFSGTSWRGEPRRSIAGGMSACGVTGWNAGDKGPVRRKIHRLNISSYCFRAFCFITG